MKGPSGGTMKGNQVRIPGQTFRKKGRRRPTKHFAKGAALAAEVSQEWPVPIRGCGPRHGGAHAMADYGTSPLTRGPTASGQLLR